MFRRREFLKTLGLLALAPYACTGEPRELIGLPDDPPDDPPNEPPGTNPNRVAVSPDDPHYFISRYDEPLFLLGFGHPLDWYHPTRFADMQTAYIDRGLSFLRIFLPWAGPHSDLVAYTHQRTGPGNALDGNLKFDLEQIDTRFLDRLENVISWAQANEIYCEVGLWHDWPFELRSFGQEVDYNWQGSVVNPANRINTEADELSVNYFGRPSFYDILFSDPLANWDSEADRTWLRDVVKAVFDAVLARLAPYHNWWFELGSRAYFNARETQYWANYVRGTAHAFDDGAVSPNAKSDVLLTDQPFEPAGSSIVGTGLVQKQTIPERGAVSPIANINELFAEVQSWNRVDRVLYDDNILMMANPEGYPLRDDRENRRRSAWQALLGGGHYDGMQQHNSPPDPPSTADYLPDFQVVMTFVRTLRGDTTIEQLLVKMKPANTRIVAGTAYCLSHKVGQTERYLVFAPAGTNPTLSVDSAGLTITRLDATSGVEDTDPASPTAAGNNALTGTGNDTAWWIA